jgi:hypothetical protein
MTHSEWNDDAPSSDCDDLRTEVARLKGENDRLRRALVDDVLVHMRTPDNADEPRSPVNAWSGPAPNGDARTPC